MEKAAEHARSGDLDYFKDLPEPELQRIIGRKDEDGRSLVHNAASGGNAQLLSYLLDSGGASSVTRGDDEGWTPLHSAVSAGHEAVAQLLLTAGADVNAVNSADFTPLHYAASKGRAPILRMLLQAGANVNAKDKSTGSTPLHRACSAGQAEAVKVLVEEGKAKLDALDRRRQTPLMVAADCGHRTPALILVAAGSNVEVVASLEGGFVCSGVLSGREEVGQAEDETGETPLSAAANHAGLRDAMVALAKGEVELDDLISI